MAKALDVAKYVLSKLKKKNLTYEQILVKHSNAIR